MKKVGLTPCWSVRGAPTHPYNMRTGSTPTGSSQKIWMQMLRNVQRNQFNSMPNTIHQWERKSFSRVSNMEEVINPQPQYTTCLKISDIS